ncbi:hypothetical protein SAMN05216376_105218 [Mameliella alba]|uniref:hypothetical protein n=1 Tax=Mameliella alba TaxID=561184 RepID=UPI000884A44C|nr:hypothetical protein [Mameliella alba]OWV48268.1 hypothetical protein CDZ96_10650 [Mameliella alba]PTR40309.1 hypothetical protein LX94_01791 [Mameliella alba]GGF43982.1 hypothetical protein GCM10011319_02200 [Mameliella alba]SDC98969.1 hypothetical protein SAMN05216376_105218 [Mameliella alba]
MARDELNFLELLQTFRRGELLREMDTRLAEVLEAIQETGNSGEITLKLPLKVNKAGQIECVPQVTAKKPRRELGAGIYFLSDDARLSRRDPNQGDWLDEVESRRDAAE